jgi:hypothetical protein
MTKKGTAQAGIAVAAALIAGVLVAGCSGTSDSTNQVRERLEAAAAKTAASSTLQSSALAEHEGGNGPEPAGCAEARVDRAATPKIEERLYPRVCGRGKPREVIAIGDRGWYAPRPGRWIAFRVAPGLTAELADAGKRFDRLFAAASNFKETGDGGEFDAPPAAALPAPRAESGELQLVAKINQAGYLSSLTLAGSEGGARTVLKKDYGDFGAPQRIVPPHPAEVTGHRASIKSEAELEEAFEIFP